MSGQNTIDNKRIAKNTLFLYFRMMSVFVVSLYTSRVILAALGVVDYGIYNVVGGVVMMFSFINSSMSTSTQRFLTFELGRGHISRLKSTFAASLNVHIFLGLIIVFLAETIGLWFVNEKLVIPPDRMLAANIVYQCCVWSFFVSITQVPYNASLIAHEKMSIYAYLSIIDVVLKLAIAYAVAYYAADKLIFYAILILLFQIFLRMLYRMYCIRHYEECHFSLFWDKSLYRRLMSFAGWNLFGSIAWLLRGQGLNILLNMFYGPVLNAAKGISDRVSHSVMGFIRNFNTAMNPQITKNYAVGNLEGMETLCYRGAKFAFLLLLLVAMPAIINMRYILNLWLVEVPDYTESFVILMLIDSLIDVLMGTSQFITALMATGSIRNYQIVVGIMIMMVLPIGYLLLSMGLEPTTVIYAMIGVSAISDFTRFLFCKHQIGFSLRRLATTVWIPSLLSVAVALSAAYAFKSYIFTSQGVGGFLLNCLMSIMLVSTCGWFIAMTKGERMAASKLINKKIRNYRGGKGL